MLALVAIHNRVAADKLQAVLLRHGHECPPSHVVPIEKLLSTATRVTPAPDLIVVILEADEASNLEVVTRVTSHLKATLVVIAPARDPQQILSAIRAGAHDYLDLQQDVETQLADLLTRLKAKNGAQAIPGRTLTFASPSGGTGVSTIAANVATALAQSRHRCALLEFNSQFGGLAAFFSLTPRHTLFDLTEKLDRLDVGMLEQAMLKHASGVHLLPGAVAPIPNREIVPNVSSGVVNVARQGFPFVVVEAGRSFYGEGMQQLCTQSDMLFLVVRLDFVALREARQAIEYFKWLGRDPATVSIIANGYGQPGQLPAGKAKRALETSVTHYVSYDPRNVNFCLNCGNPVVLETPRTRVAKDLRKVVASVLTGDPVIPSNGIPETTDADRSNAPTSATALVKKVLWPVTPG